jgi:hypothetical protein
MDEKIVPEMCAHEAAARRFASKAVSKGHKHSGSSQKG